MEIHIIIALSLTVLILFFLLTRQRDEVARLRAEVETLKRLEPEVVRLQRRVSEDVHKASDLEVEVTRLQTALSKKKQHKQPFANFNQPPPEIYYTDPYWEQLSAWYRQEQGWTCEECGIDLKKRTFFLHTHHIRGRRYNTPEYFKALCIVCHAEEPYHDFIKRTSDYLRFLRTPEYRNHARNRKIQQS